MIDPLISLAHAMQARKGAYALLLGSGVSRAASIPTGWEVVLDLIRKIAAAEGADCGDNPEGWYRSRFGKEPDYSQLLDSLAKTPAERQQILERYFEPTEEQKDTGEKRPTDAHKAIAGLVASGHIRVIITTNFDRLIEHAVEDVGITPVVLSTSDQIEGALPVVHQKCVILKLSGDYLDPRIKNTAQELAEYAPCVDQYLDRIFDEFGLIVCGWSGEWDIALRNALNRCKSRRFTTFWTTLNELQGGAKRLVDHRGAETIQIENADEFFGLLAEKIDALESLAQPHPLSVAAATATTKRLIAEDRFNVRLHELITTETERAVQLLRESCDRALGGQRKGQLTRFIAEAKSSLTVLEGIVGVAAFWCRPLHQLLLAGVPGRLTKCANRDGSGMHLHFEMQALPSIRTAYIIGIAAIANSRWILAAQMLQHLIRDELGSQKAYVMAIDWGRVHGLAHEMLGATQRRYPQSEWLFEDIRPSLGALIPDDDVYARCFDHFEIVMSLMVMDFWRPDSAWTEGGVIAAPLGRFVYKSFGRMKRDDTNHFELLKCDQEALNQIIMAGAFAKNLPRLRSALSALQHFSIECANRMY